MAMTSATTGAAGQAQRCESPELMSGEGADRQSDAGYDRQGEADRQGDAGLQKVLF
ncbi:MAG: hypothetical protein R3B97_12800 [Dehalococcoidia bacterium]